MLNLKIYLLKYNLKNIRKHEKSGLANDLLAILRNILTDAEFEAYQQTEADKGYYERINWRLRSIQFLTALEDNI